MGHTQTTGAPRTTVATMTEINVRIAQKIYPATGKVSEQCVIKNLNFSMACGEFCCLVGPSGCGKTTLLHILAGLDNNYDGQITPIHRDSTEPSIGYVFQEPRLLPWRTVRENIEIALRPDQPTDCIDELLDAMDLTIAEHVYPERLSLGMSRRAALARAFAIQPDLLLMDEPFVSLDAPTARRVRELLVNIWYQQRPTVLFVTHDLREAIELGDRLLFLSSTPSRLVTSITVDIPRDQRSNDSAIESFRQQLLSRYSKVKALL